MFGAFVRGVAAYAAGILLWTPLDEFVDRAVTDHLEPNLGQGSTVVWALESAVKYWPILLLIIISTSIIARAMVESRLGGRPA